MRADDEAGVVEVHHDAHVGAGRHAVGAGETNDVLLDDEPVAGTSADVGILDSHPVAFEAVDSRQQAVDAVYRISVLSHARIGGELLAHGIELLRRKVFEQLSSMCLEVHGRTVFA